MKKPITLVFMAAGMASRYGSAKQIEGMGPNGEILMEYSMHDALRAGFDRVVFIIKPEMRERMGEILAARVKSDVEIAYAYQSNEGLQIPEGRTKPLGTAHAVLCAADVVDGPFAVLNADDYYGVDAFAKIADFLRNDVRPGVACMMGYKLKNTVSPSGTVTRGLCETEDGILTRIVETKKIALLPDGTIKDSETDHVLEGEMPVSMNFWGFSETIFEPMAKYFDNFMEKMGPNDLKAECLLPEFVGELVDDKAIEVHVLETDATWFGVTYPEDRPGVVAALQKLHDEGVY